MRWRQNPDGTFTPIDEAAARRDAAAGKLQINVRDFDAFRSPVDGSLIRNHRDLYEHNRRNGVVNAAEFGTEHYERKARERERLAKGEHTRKEQLQRKQEIYERWIAAERHHNAH